jgi:glycosyltransferase involved in cell wall biosynthesis
VELLLVGAEEDVLFLEIQEICHTQKSRLHYVSFTPTPEHYMSAADIFCMPSYREGFGMTIIEAAGCGLPAVASRIYGITDAVADGQSGLLFPAGDVTTLVQLLLVLTESSALRKSMGALARARVEELFTSKKITCELINIYDELLCQKQYGECC